MKVDLKTNPQKIKKTVKTVVNNNAPQILAEKFAPKRPFNSVWSALERRAENMSPQEYIEARHYLASLEQLHLLAK